VVSLTGSSGDDVFDPGIGIGAATMTGGGGDDVFYVHSGADHVVVPAGPGRSTIIVDGMAAYTLPANVANLVGASTSAMNLTGNAMDNVVRANGYGDTLDGGAGNDTLVGGAGHDTFVETRGNGSDTIVNFLSGTGGDTVSLRGYGFTSFTAVQAALRQSGGNVVLALGNGETLTFTGHAVGDFIAANFGMAAAAGAAPGAGGGSSSSAPPPASVTHSPLIASASSSSQVVGLVLQNPTSGVLGARYVTFGQEFAAGQVPAGRVLVATIGGVAQAVQMDVKATNPDGSVRMAVLTLRQPVLAANASQGVMLSLAPAGTAAGGAVDIGGLAAGGTYNLTVDLSLHDAGGTVTAYHIDAARALQAALAAGTASPWLSGPDATQVRVDVPVAGSLHVTLDITAYADGTTSTDIAFDNDIATVGAMTASGGTVTYDATIRQNGAVAFSQAGIRQFQYQTWHQVVTSNGAPAVNVQHDIAALEAAGFVQNYDLSNGVSTALISADTAQMTAGGTTVLGTPSFGVLGNAGVTQYMPTTGGRGDIGPTTLANTLWLGTQNADAARYALAQADAAGSVPWHLYDSATGSYLTATDAPTLWADMRGGTSSGTTGLAQKVPQYATTADPESGWSVDPAHQPDLSYVPYLMTGSRYYLDQLDAQASYDILALAPSYRQNGAAIVAGNPGQVRAQAWDLRALEEAAYVTPDGSPLKAYFTQALNDTFTYLVDTVMPQGTATEGAVYGWLQGNNGSGDLSPWQQDYFGQVVVLAAEQGNAQAAQFLAWESNFLVGRFLNGGNGFDPHDGAAYNLKVGTPGSFAQSWAALDSASGAQTNGAAADWSGGWSALEYPGYREWALATLAGDFTVTQDPAALRAFGWLEANAGLSASWKAGQPQYDIVPRLPDGQLLTEANMHVLTGGAPASVAYGNADELVYDAGSAGNTTITGGAGVDILFAGAGHDLLLGGAGNDYLYGGAGGGGMDTLSGGAGGNWMQAGADGAEFILATPDTATDIIAGFVPGRDHLHVTGTAGTPLTPAAINALIAAATPTPTGGLTLTLAPTHTVTIQNLTKPQLTPTAFV
jgi:hypothetical protein